MGGGAAPVGVPGGGIAAPNQASPTLDTGTVAPSFDPVIGEKDVEYKTDANVTPVCISYPNEENKEQVDLKMKIEGHLQHKNPQTDQYENCCSNRVLRIIAAPPPSPNPFAIIVEKYYDVMTQVEDGQEGAFHAEFTVDRYATLYYLFADESYKPAPGTLNQLNNCMGDGCLIPLQPKSMPVIINIKKQSPAVPEGGDFPVCPPPVRSKKSHFIKFQDGVKPGGDSVLNLEDGKDSTP